MMEVYLEALMELALPNTGVIDFSWFSPDCQKFTALRHDFIIETKTNTVRICVKRCTDTHRRELIPNLFDDRLK